MSEFQLASVLVETLTTILAEDGLYLGQRAIVTDHNNAELYWSGETDRWKWIPTWQLAYKDHRAVSVTTTNTETPVRSYFLPALGPDDMLRVSHFWTFGTGTSNTKTIRVRIDATLCFELIVDLATQLSTNLVHDVRNMNDPSVQRWVSQYGVVTTTTPTMGLLAATTTKVLGTAGKELKVAGKNQVGTDTMTLECVDVWICGGVAVNT